MVIFGIVGECMCMAVCVLKQSRQLISADYVEQDIPTQVMQHSEIVVRFVPADHWWIQSTTTYVAQTTWNRVYMIW